MVKYSQSCFVRIVTKSFPMVPIILNALPIPLGLDCFSFDSQLKFIHDFCDLKSVLFLSTFFPFLVAWKSPSTALFGELHYYCVRMFCTYSLLLSTDSKNVIHKGG